MKKKFLLTMLVISMLTLMGSGKLSAQNDVSTYAKLVEAINNASEGATITLGADIDVSTTNDNDRITIEGKTLTIDLNGYKVSANDPEDDVFCIEGYKGTGANVTFKNGTIKHSSCGIISKGDNAANVIKLNGVTIDDGGDANHSAIYHNGTSYGCNLTIENSTISSQLYGLYISGSTSWNPTQFNTVSIKNSTITSTIAKYQNSADEGTAVEIKRGNLTVENSTITANSPVISMSNNGNGPCSSGFAIALTNNPDEASSGTVNIISGTFEGAIGIKGDGGTVVPNPNPTTKTESATISISGGTFSNETLPDGLYTGGNYNNLLSSYCAEGYKFEYNEVTETYDIYSTVEGRVAKIVKGGETKYYASLQDAVEEADGQTITLLQNVTVNATEKTDIVTIIGQELTIDLNGKTIEGQGSVDDIFSIEANTENPTAIGANVTIKNGTIINNCCGIYSYGGHAENIIVLDNVTIGKTNASYFAVYHNGTNYGCNLTIKGGSTIESKLGVFISGRNGWSDKLNGDKLNNVRIENSTIISSDESAVEVKQGNLYVTNSTIKALDETLEMVNHSNGSCSSGFAIALTNNYNVDENGDVTNDVSTGKIEIVSGTFEGAIGIKGEGGTVIENTGTATISISGGTFSNENLPEGVYTTLLDGYCAAGYVLEVNEDGTYGVVNEGSSVAMIVNGATTTYYASLKAAVEAASTENIETVTLLKDFSGSGVVINKSITIDFNGKTYSFKEPAVGSTGTETLGFQILQGKTVKLQNGTLNVHSSNAARLAFAMLIQNYANLTITDMTLDGTNLDRYLQKDYNYSYVLSNNCGEVKVNGNTTIIANPGGEENIDGYANKDNHHGVAFDVCKFDNYEAPVVTVNTEGNIKGVVEVSAKLHLEAIGTNNITRIDMSGDGELYHYGGFTARITKEVAAYNSKENWATISSPIAGSPVELGDVVGLITDDNTYGLYRYNEGLELWENKLETNDFTTLETGRGYIYANKTGTTIIFNGSFNTTSKTVNLSKSENGSYAGFNLIGNPFTHAIYYENFVTTAELANGFYVMDASGAWVPKTGDAKIGAMESVFVKTSETTTLTINPTTPTKGSKSRGENNGILEINVANAKYNDVAYVSFNKGLGLDKIAHRNDEIPMVYVPVDGTDYAVAIMSKDVTEIPVSFMAMTMGEYTFSAKAIDCEFEQMYLVDRMTGIETNLLMDDYTFMAKSGDNAERFIIRMENSANANTNTENFVFVNNDELIFNNIAGEGIIRIIDVLGRPVAEYNVFGSANISTTSFRSGVYMIQMSDENGVKVQKVIVD